MGKGFEIKWNKGALERAVKDATREGLVQSSRNIQQQLDAVLAAAQGKSATEVKPMLQDAFRKVGGSISEPELSQYAEILARGQRIVIEPRLE